MQINIQGSIDRVNADLVFAVPAISKAATFTALNKTNSKIGTQFRRQLAGETGVAQKHFRKKVKQYRARYFRLTAKTYIGLRASVPLARLVKGAKGVGKYEKLITDSLQGKSATDTFIAKMPNGYTGIFVRNNRSDNKAGRDRNGKLKRGRLPITEVRAKFDRIAPDVLNDAGDRVGPSEFERQYIYDMRRRLAMASR